MEAHQKRDQGQIHGERYIETTNILREITQLIKSFVQGNDYSLRRFEQLVETERFKEFLTADEAARLKRIGRALLRLNADCEKAGHYTPEALNFVQNYGTLNPNEEKLLNSQYAQTGAGQAG